jgi:hypothetical protein
VPTMLYYPLINAPRAALYQAVLYWDRISTLVPAGPHQRYLDPLMRAVEDAGLYQPLRPTDQDQWFQQQMVNSLTSFADRLPSDLEPDVGLEDYAHPLYIRKFDQRVLYRLRERGLIRSADLGDLGGRIYVSAHTHICLLSILARETAALMTLRMGHIATDSLIPCTDQSAAHHLA